MRLYPEATVTSISKTLVWKWGVSNGYIVFDAEAGNTWELTFNDFRFPASNNLVQSGQLSIEEGSSTSTLSDISVDWMINPPYGKQSPTGSDWNRPGNVLPWYALIWFNDGYYKGRKWTSTGRYVKFTYIHESFLINKNLTLLLNCHLFSVHHREPKINNCNF